MSKTAQVIRWLHATEEGPLECPLCDMSHNICLCYPPLNDDTTATKTKDNNSSKNGSKKKKYSFGHWISRKSGKSGKREKRESNNGRCSSSNLIKGCTVQQVRWSIAQADLLFRCEDILFPVHRAVLSRASHVFRECVHDTDTLVLELPVKPQHLATALDHVYGFDVHLDNTNINHVRRVGERFGIESLVDRCNAHAQRLKGSRWERERKCYTRLQNLFGFKIFSSDWKTVSYIWTFCLVAAGISSVISLLLKQEYFSFDEFVKKQKLYDSMSEIIRIPCQTNYLRAIWK